MYKSKLYIITTIALLVGYVYLFYAYYHPASQHGEPAFCFIKTLTGYACPSCGSTRSLLAMLHADWKGALYWNPFGLLLLGIMSITPFWMLFDVCTRKATFFNFYLQAELFLKRRSVMYIGIMLVLANWIWNINKGL